MAFLEVLSDVDTLSLDVISGARTIFRIYVHKYALKGRDAWKRIGSLPLTEHEKTPDRYRKQDKLSGRLTIYQGSPFGTVGEWKDIPATAEETRDLEAAAVWDRHHVESRLNDHFAGLENVWVKNTAL